MAADVRVSARLSDSSSAAAPAPRSAVDDFHRRMRLADTLDSGIRVSRDFDPRRRYGGLVRRDQPGDDHHSGHQHDRQAMGFQPASRVAARPAPLRRRKAIGESSRPSTERLEDRAALARRETKRPAFFIGTHGTNRRDRSEFWSLQLGPCKAIMPQIRCQ